MEPGIVHPIFVLSDERKEQLEEALKGSWYGRNVFRGLHAYSGDHGICHRVSVYAVAVFATLFYGAGAYLTCEGAWKMAQMMFPDQIQADIGHVGEWPMQMFECGLAIYLCVLLPFSNRGSLEDVKGIYRDVIADLINSGEERDISDFYQELENNIVYLSKRAFSNTDLFEIRLFLLDLFQNADMNILSCPDLELDRQLVNVYQGIRDSIEKSRAWTPSNAVDLLSTGLQLLAERGVGQAVVRGIGMTAFDLGVLICSAFMLWGFTAVINEAYISGTGPESSGHLFGWTLGGLLTSLVLIYTAYSYTIKREAVLHRTKKIMEEHLRPQDVEAQLPYTQEQRDRLVNMCNDVLDQLAEKCDYNTLPSQYRFKPNFA